MSRAHSFSWLLYFIPIFPAALRRRSVITPLLHCTAARCGAVRCAAVFSLGIAKVRRQRRNDIVWWCTVVLISGRDWTHAHVHGARATCRGVARAFEGGGVLGELYHAGALRPHVISPPGCRISMWYVTVSIDMCGRLGVKSGGSWVDLGISGGVSHLRVLLTCCRKCPIRHSPASHGSFLFLVQLERRCAPLTLPRRIHVHQSSFSRLISPALICTHMERRPCWLRSVHCASAHRPCPALHLLACYSFCILRQRVVVFPLHPTPTLLACLLWRWWWPSQWCLDCRPAISLTSCVVGVTLPHNSALYTCRLTRSVLCAWTVACHSSPLPVPPAYTAFAKPMGSLCHSARCHTNRGALTHLQPASICHLLLRSFLHLPFLTHSDRLETVEKTTNSNIDSTTISNSRCN